MEFYSLLQVTFTANNTIRDKKSYTIYEIEIRSSSTITWVIYKRYSDFDTLHQELNTILNVSVIDKLPILPPKSFTNNFDQVFVEKRKQGLEIYLRGLLAIPDVVHLDLVARWLEVPDSVRAMLQQRPGAANNTNASAPLTADSNRLPATNEDTDDKENNSFLKRMQAQKTPEDVKIAELLIQLKKQNNKVAALRDFEVWYFEPETHQKFTGEQIRLLFLGDDAASGLIAGCGNFAYSDIASRASLELLCRLLDVEKNKDASIFLDYFCHLDRHYLKMLQLHLHCLKEHGSRQGAFAIVQILKERLPQLPLEVYLQDSLARQEYFRWLECRSDISSTLNSQDNQLKALNLKDINYKTVLDQAGAEMIKHAQMEQGWRVVNSEEEKGVQITYRKEFNKDIYVLKTIAVLPYSCSIVFNLLRDLDRRVEWDLKFHSGRVIEVLDDTTDVGHFVFKSFSSPYKYRDFCLLRTIKKNDDGTIISIYRSITHSQCPELKDHVRAILYPTGQILTPCKLSLDNDSGSTVDACLYTYISQMDREAVLINSPDLLGETDELLYSIRQFKYLLDCDHSQLFAENVASPLDSLHSKSKYLPHAPLNSNNRNSKNQVTVGGKYVISPIQSLLEHLNLVSTEGVLCKTCSHIHGQSEANESNTCVCGCNREYNSL